MSGREMSEESVDLVERQGEVVLSVHWDSGAPGMGANTELVYRLGDRYYLLSESTGYYGPYNDIDELLDEHGILILNTTTKSIDWPSMGPGEVLRRCRIDFDIQPGYTVVINGCRYTRSATGRLERSA